MTDAGASGQTYPTWATGEPRAEVPRPARSVDRLAAIVRLAVEEDDSSGLVQAAAEELGRPLGLVGLAGEPLAHAPDGSSGRRALAVASAVARRIAMGPPPGWRVVTIGPADAGGGLLAVGAGRPGAAGGALLDPIVALLGEQLLRRGLRRDETEAFIRRLVSEPVGVQSARAEAAALGLALPDAYWPAVIGWDDGVPTPAELDGIGRAAQRRVHGSLAVALHGHLVLLYPPGACGSDVMGWMEQIVSVARATVPALAARAVAADQEVAVHELREQVARLARLCARRGSGPPVTRARQHALEDLLSESVAPAEARRFVDDLLGPLIAWDHQHHSDLIRVLEAALDHPRHDIAAQRCFMHRNTFRHRLGKARDLLGDDLTDPKTRLAVHVALKLRRATAVAERVVPAGRGHSADHGR